MMKDDLEVGNISYLHVSFDFIWIWIKWGKQNTNGDDWIKFKFDIFSPEF
jgi:hypothetical protein